KRSEPIGEPGDAVGRVVQHGRGDAGFLQYAVSIAERTDPAQVDVERAYRATANYQCRVGRVVRDGVDHAPRRPGLGIVASGAQIHDLQRGNYILGRIENLEDRAVGSFERLAQDKSKFVLEHRRNEAMGRYLRAVLIKHVVEQHAVIGFVDVEHRLHGPRGKADLMSDNFATLGELDIDPRLLHRVPVGIGDLGKLGGRKPDHLPGLLGFVKFSGQSLDRRNVHYCSEHSVKFGGRLSEVVDDRQSNEGAKPDSPAYVRRGRPRHDRIVRVVKILVIIGTAGILGFLAGRNV